MSLTRILCEKCKHPLAWCACDKDQAASVRPSPKITRPRRALLLERLVSWWRQRRIRRTALRMVAESRARMDGYTPEQLNDLYDRGMKIVNEGKMKPPANAGDVPRPRGHGQESETKL